MKRWSRRTVPIRRVLAACALLAVAGSAWAQPPELSFEEQAVMVTGMSPEGRAAVLGVSLGFNGFTRYVLRHDELVAADAGGSARLELDLPVSPASVWAAVDLGTGEVGVGAPAGSEVRRIALDREAVDADGRSVTERRLWADLLWVRPGGADGSGVWGARLRDGGADDQDGVEDRSIRAPVSAFVAIEERGPIPPERLAAGDVLVVIDPETLEISATRLSERRPSPDR